MKKTLALLAIAAAHSLVVHADSWIEKDHVRTWRFANGSVRVDVVNDAKNRYSARRYIRITEAGRALATINEAGFDTIAAPPDESFFVGISNSGLDRTAVIVFSRDGSVLLQVAHDVGHFDYCSESITIDRTWHGSEAKDIRFGKNLDDISILDCHGTRVRLLQAVSDALRGPRPPALVE